MNRRTLLGLALTTVAGLGAPVVAGGPADAAGSPVRITKIHYAQSGTNLNTEYIVFKNVTAKKRWITGWRIISAPSTDNQYYVFPSTAIPAGKTLVLYTGSGTNGAGKRYWGASGPRWDNGGDKAILKNGAGTTMDVCQYAGGGTTAYC